MTTKTMNFQGDKSRSEMPLRENPRIVPLEMYLSPRISLEKSLAHPQIEHGHLQTLQGDEQVSLNFPLKVR